MTRRSVNLQVIELRFLGSLPLLETLIITGNPVTVVPDYRIQVLKIFTDRAKQVCDIYHFNFNCTHL